MDISKDIKHGKHFIFLSKIPQGDNFAIFRCRNRNSGLVDCSEHLVKLQKESSKISKKDKSHKKNEP